MLNVLGVLRVFLCEIFHLLNQSNQETLASFNRSELLTTETLLNAIASPAKLDKVTLTGKSRNHIVEYFCANFSYQSKFLREEIWCCC